MNERIRHGIITKIGKSYWYGSVNFTTAINQIKKEQMLSVKKEIEYCEKKYKANYSKLKERLGVK